MKKIMMLAAMLAVFVFAPTFGAVAADVPTLRLCTGKDGLNYVKAGDILSKNAIGKVDIQTQQSQGSPDNLEFLNRPLTDAKHCDAAFVQSDVLVTYAKKYPPMIAGLRRGGVLYDEWAHMLCNKNSGITNITELTEKNTVAIGSETQGHNVTWQGFKNAAASGWFSSTRRYDKVNVNDDEMGYTVLQQVDEGEIDCALIVSAFGTSLIADDAKEFKNLVFVPTNDDDLKTVKDAKGNAVYVFGEIPDGQYADSLYTDTWGYDAVETIGVQAVLVVRKEWVAENSKGYENLIRAFKASGDGFKALGSPKK